MIMLKNNYLIFVEVFYFRMINAVRKVNSSKRRKSAQEGEHMDREEEENNNEEEEGYQHVQQQNVHYSPQKDHNIGKEE